MLFTCPNLYSSIVHCTQSTVFYPSKDSKNILMSFYKHCLKELFLFINRIYYIIIICNILS